MYKRILGIGMAWWMVKGLRVNENSEEIYNKTRIYGINDKIEIKYHDSSRWAVLTGVMVG